MATSTTAESVRWSELAWAALWFVFGALLVVWMLFAVGLVLVELAFRHPTADDYLALGSFVIVCPIGFAAAFASLHRQKFSLWATATICFTALLVAWNGERLADPVVGLDLLAVVLAVAAILRRSAGLTTVFLVVLGMVLSVWLAVDGKMTLYELT